DPGRAWRMTFGAWTAHVAMLWLVGGGGHLRRLRVMTHEAELPWRKRERMVALAAGPALLGLALLFAQYVNSGWYFWTAAAVVGAVFALAALAFAAVAASRAAVRWFRPPVPHRA
ncbi:MAG: hypothetical protein QGD94_12610, partial [Planctomycetia bacterium]|nr:hypothetical protein [Planctomycetia bacterium]